MKLIHKIIDNLDLLSLYSLQLTCRYIFIISQEHFRSRFDWLYRVSGWSGNRIAAVGDYAHFVPKHMLPVIFDTDDPDISLESVDQHLLKIFKKEEDMIVDGEYDDAGQKVKGSMYHLSLYDFCKSDLERSDEPIMDFSFDEPEYPDVIEGCREELFSLPQKYRRIASEWGIYNKGVGPSSQITSKHYIDAGETLLRNLTTREYVRHSGISVSKEHCIGAWNVGPVGFIEALKCMFCFSNKGRTELGLDPPRDLDRGPWAGHRFDIVTLEEHNEEVKTRGVPKDYWKDVSFEVRKKIKSIWDGDDKVADEFGASYELLTPAQGSNA